MTTYPAAFYVNVLDGVAGSLSFVSSTTGSVYEPAGPGYANIVTQDFADTPGILEITPDSPAVPGIPVGNSITSYKGGGASWQNYGGFVWSFDGTHHLKLSYDGSSLPTMTAGVQPAGWRLRERGWQAESLPVSGLVTASSFYDADDPDLFSGTALPENEYPVYLVPYFGGYSAANGLSCSITTPSYDSVYKTCSDVTVTVTLPKPLNPNQQAGLMSFTLGTPVGIPGLLSLPVSATQTVTPVHNGSGQITGFSILIAFSAAAPDLIQPGASYGLALSVTQPLTYLSGSGLVTQAVSICYASCVVPVAQETAGPLVTSAVLDTATARNGQVLHTATMDYYDGPVQVTFTALDPAGVDVSGAVGALMLMFPGAGANEQVWPPVSITLVGTNTWRAVFDCHGIPSGAYAPYLVVPNLLGYSTNCNVSFANSTATSGEITLLRPYDVPVTLPSIAGNSFTVSAPSSFFTVATSGYSHTITVNGPDSFTVTFRVPSLYVYSGGTGDTWTPVTLGLTLTDPAGWSRTVTGTGYQETITQSTGN